MWRVDYIRERKKKKKKEENRNWKTEYTSVVVSATYTVLSGVERNSHST
jgi:hypothetical protein